MSIEGSAGSLPDEKHIHAAHLVPFGYFPPPCVVIPPQPARHSSTATAEGSAGSLSRLVSGSAPLPPPPEDRATDFSEAEVGF